MENLRSWMMAIREINKFLLRVKDEPELFQEVCRQITKIEHIKHAWIGLIEEGTRDVIAAAQSGFESGVPPSLGASRDDLEYGLGPIGTAIQTRRPCVTSDIASDPRFEPWRHVALESAVSSGIAVPLLCEDEVLGALVACSSRSDGLGDDEVGFLVEISGDIAVGLRSLRLRRKVEESETRYRSLFQNMLNGCAYHKILVDDTNLPTDYVFLEINDAFERQTGLKRGEVIGRRVTEVIPDIENSAFDWIGTYGKVALTGEGIRFEQYAEPLARWYSVSAYRPEKDHFVSVFTEITDLKRIEEMLRQNLSKVQIAMEGTVQAIAQMVEMRDPYTAGHQRRVAQLACAIEREMDCAGAQCEGVHVAALLHDTGKISVPAQLLSKAGKLSPDEMAILMTHPQVGYDVLKSIEFPWEVARTVAQHHERMDGSGYPFGLRGDDILLDARVVAVADVVEAMSSHRPYRPALGVERALEEIFKNKGSLYDSSVVEACLRIFAEGHFAFE